MKPRFNTYCLHSLQGQFFGCLFLISFLKAFTIWVAMGNGSSDNSYHTHNYFIRAAGIDIIGTTVYNS